MTFLYTKIERELPEEVKKWLAEEIAEQDERYQKIVAEMAALDTTRDQWYEEFFERLKKYGFNQDGDQRVKIPDEELPAKPDRKHTVVY
jgi:alkylation response protein AidB-like acyl-CoA dehydrogenase